MDDRCEYRRRHPRSAGDDVGQQCQPRADLLVAAWPAQPVIVDEVDSCQCVQSRDGLKGGALPHADQRRCTALQRLRDPQRPRQHGVGLVLGQLQ